MSELTLWEAIIVWSCYSNYVLYLALNLNSLTSWSRLSTGCLANESLALYGVLRSWYGFLSLLGTRHLTLRTRCLRCHMLWSNSVCWPWADARGVHSLGFENAFPVVLSHRKVLSSASMDVTFCIMLRFFYFFWRGFFLYMIRPSLPPVREFLVSWCRSSPVCCTMNYERYVEPREGALLGFCSSGCVIEFIFSPELFVELFPGQVPTLSRIALNYGM